VYFCDNILVNQTYHYHPETASSDGLVTVGLQLPDGVRAVMNVPASTTLWALLLQCEKEKSCNIVASADKGGFYRQPVLAFLNKEVRCIRIHD